MAFKALIPRPLEPEAERILTDAGIEIIRGSGPEKETLMRDVAEVDAAMVIMPYRYDREVIDAGRKLKLITRFGVGMEIIDVAYAQSKGIIVSNTPTSSSNAVAEHAMFLIMSCARNAHFVDTMIHAGEFKGVLQRPFEELEGKTLGIIGPGRIGSLLAKKAAHGFGMRVLGYSLRPSTRTLQDMERVDALDQLLSQSDYVSISIPETPETTGMIGMDQFRNMKRSACLINTARGHIVREKDLIQALQEGIIRGAGLDVFEKEPLDRDNPLLAMDNVILTPHCAYATRESNLKCGIEVAEAMVSVSRGQRPMFELPRETEL